ncbi:sigma 54-interacting transcriptional regulator [Thiohalorhabdus sp.]|uniref:sigma 54-interacting transcriptional regulator n=1 Tax=Thiohalorhabdus sp. TaxID=3094134 RepID=UPI002FC2E8FD
MTDFSLSELSPMGFLQALLTQGWGEDGDRSAEAVRHQIATIAESAATCFESAYRADQTLPEPLDLAGYADMITGIKNQIGGNFARASSPPSAVRVLNHRCPFGQTVTEAPALCQMTASVFGSIAARNFGWARVVLEKRLAVGDDCCSVAVYTDPEQAPAGAGQVYKNEANVVGENGSQRVQERLKRFWCRQSETEGPGIPAIVAESPAMRGILETIEIAAPTDANVLIQGETGTGKEVVARSIHALGSRASQRFVAVNCGAIPEGLFESLVFGHERGAFTGAHEVHHGYIEQANGGTLFLDEVDTLPPLLQAKLLRVLQEGYYERVGGSRPLQGDVRVVAATNADLVRLVEGGQFRTDLYYRLNVIPIALPPLRERLEDIDALVDHFLEQLHEQYQQGRKQLGPEAWSRVLAHSWPGNVRELENALERGYLFSKGPVIQSLDLGDNRAPTTSPPPTNNLRMARKQVADRLEARILKETLAQAAGNVRWTAEQLGLSPRAVQMKIRHHGIDPALFQEPAASRRNME